MTEAAQEDLAGMPTPGLLTVSEKFPINVKNDEGTVVAQGWADGRFTGEQYAALIVKAVNGHEKLLTFLRAFDAWREAEDDRAAAEDSGPYEDVQHLCEAEATAQTELIKARSAIAEVKP